MRVALVCPYDLDRFGGVQDLVLDLATWLRGAYHDAWVVGPGEGAEGVIGVGRSRVINVNGSAAPIAIGPGVARRVREAVGGADVVHVHEPLVPLVSLAAARMSAHAVVGTFHADPSAMIRRLYRYGAAPLQRLMRGVDAVTAVSPVAESAIAQFGQVTLVPNGIDTAAFDPRPGDPKRVAFLGRDDPRKGLDVLLEAWPMVRRAVPNAELVVASGGRTGDIDGVTFIGGVGPEERRELLAGASVYCAPNLGGESFGIVLVQAMASGCAVVASALPAFAHVLGDAGLLVKPGDSEGLAASLVAVLSDHTRRETLREAALARVRRFDGAVVTAAYVEVYEAAIARREIRARG